MEAIRLSFTLADSGRGLPLNDDDESSRAYVEALRKAWEKR
jgi:hypothetical protein